MLFVHIAMGYMPIFIVPSLSDLSSFVFTFSSKVCLIQPLMFINQSVFYQCLNSVLFVLHILYVVCLVLLKWLCSLERNST